MIHTVAAAAKLIRPEWTSNWCVCVCVTHINQPDIVDSFVFKFDGKSVVKKFILHIISIKSDINAQEK